MNCTDLKQGDVIAIDWDGRQRIAIFNEFLEPGINPTDTLHIYIELDPTVKEEGLIFKCKGYDFSYDVKSITYRKATCEEQRKLYDELCKYFAEEHDKDWHKHFSDSSYYDILDFLLEELDIEDTVNIPTFVYEIQNYMWDQMCEFMGQPNKTGFTEIEEESGENYKLYTWYPLTDDEYWVEFGVLQELFPDCQTIVCDTTQGSGYNCIMTYNECPIGWGTMAKRGTFKFMIVEIPKN